jgi:hypothetical protein
LERGRKILDLEVGRRNGKRREGVLKKAMASRPAKEIGKSAEEASAEKAGK